MAKKRLKVTGEYALNKIVNVKTDTPTFYKLRTAQKEAKILVREGRRSERDFEELAITLRSALTDYITKLENFCNNGTSMRDFRGGKSS